MEDYVEPGLGRSEESGESGIAWCRAGGGQCWDRGTSFPPSVSEGSRVLSKGGLLTAPPPPPVPLAHWCRHPPDWRRMMPPVHGGSPNHGP